MELSSIFNYNLNRDFKRNAVCLLDTLLVFISYSITLLVSRAFFIEINTASKFYLFISAVSIIFIFSMNDLYSEIFRFTGFSAFIKIIKALLIIGFLGMPYCYYFLGGLAGLFFFLIYLFFLSIFVLASRFFIRLIMGFTTDVYYKNNHKQNVIIYGAGSAGRQLAVGLINSKEVNVVCFIDDDKNLHGGSIYGVKIFGNNYLRDLALLFEVKPNVLLAIPSASRQSRNRVLEILKFHNFSVRTLPDLTSLAKSDIDLNAVQDLDIDDLLGRDPVSPVLELLHENIFGKTVLITGAGGSIGSELCRQILIAKPRRMLLVEINEFALYSIHQELDLLISASGGKLSNANYVDIADADDHNVEAQVSIVPLLASVCDEMRMNNIMSTWRPETVYHAAAYKHVPLVEHNVIDGVNNNVNGTRICAEVSIRNKVNKFVLISTDKAVRPTNVMGASKRLAEMILQAFAARDVCVCFTMVRFGNVLGSSGSVVPLFRKQINKGGPITLTHKDITRYFMSIPEAAQLVLQAGALGQGGDVFLLDMGEPVKIYELAKKMIELAGLNLSDEKKSAEDIVIKITGLRPGEKLYEELLIDNEALPTVHPKIMKAHENFLRWEILESKLISLNIGLSNHDVQHVRRLLRELVVDYSPSNDLVDWVYSNKTCFDQTKF